MLSTFYRKLLTASGAMAVGGFLVLWLAIWPFWLVATHYLPARFPARSSSTHG